MLDTVPVGMMAKLCLQGQLPLYCAPFAKADELQDDAST